MQTDSYKILYVTGALTRAHTYFSYVCYPDFWYYKIQKEVLSLLKERVPNSTIKVRFYPSKLGTINKKFAQALGFESVDQSLPSLLPQEKFDLIITEACATTLLEIVCTKSQILCFFPKDFLKLSAESKNLLRKRAFLTETQEDYFKVLKDILPKNPSINPKPLNDEFLQAYGLENFHENPLNLAQKAINSILRDKL